MKKIVLVLALLAFLGVVYYAFSSLHDNVTKEANPIVSVDASMGNQYISFEEMKNAPIVDNCKTSKLKKNTTVNISASGEFAYYAKTDDQGRVKYIYAPELFFANYDERYNGNKRLCDRQQKTPGDTSSDDAGHMIANQLGGNGSLYNLVAQNEVLNRSGGWRKMERKIVEDMQNNNPVTNYSVVINYNNDELRPDRFTVSYDVDYQNPKTGKKTYEHSFKNNGTNQNLQQAKPKV